MYNVCVCARVCICMYLCILCAHTYVHYHSSPLPPQYLGYLDLYQLSIHSETRRRQVYSLDQSGR